MTVLIHGHRGASLLVLLNCQHSSCVHRHQSYSGQYLEQFSTGCPLSKTLPSKFRNCFSDSIGRVLNPPAIIGDLLERFRRLSNHLLSQLDLLKPCRVDV